MSTMYYTYPEKHPIGQTHFKGKGKGYHFTWTMFPLEFYKFATSAPRTPTSIIGGGEDFSMDRFIELVEHAASQSFEEGIE